MIDIEQFLARLDGVRAAGSNRWMARCPAHEDKSASLSIRLDEDEPRILVHDFGLDCPVGDICAAIGLRIGDLTKRVYRRPEERGTNYTGARASDVLDALADHAAAVLFVCVDLLNRDKGALTQEERKQLQAAAKAIGDARAIIQPVKRPKERK